MKLLIIDDDLSILKSMEQALRPAGYECVLCQDSHEALSRYKSEQFDVVITDYQMPGINGIEILGEIRKCDPDAYVIIITGYADLHNAIDAVNYGAHAFLCKPLNFKSIMEILIRIEKKIQREHDREYQRNL